MKRTTTIMSVAVLALALAFGLVGTAAARTSADPLTIYASASLTAVGSAPVYGVA